MLDDVNNKISRSREENNNERVDEYDYRSIFSLEMNMLNITK